MRWFVILMLLAGCGTQQPDDIATATAEASPSASPAEDPRVPVEGSRVEAIGRVERVEGRPPRLCDMNVVYGLVKHAEDYVAPPCPGIEVAAVEAPAEAVVRLEGVLRDDVLVADREEPSPGDSGRRTRLPEVPCEPPAGGWPDGGAPYDDRSPDDSALNRFNEQHPDLAASGRVMLLRPARNRTVATVVVRDEAERQRVEATLAPDFPGRACVVVQSADLGIAVQAQHDERLAQEDLLRGAWTEWAPDLRTRRAVVEVGRVTPLMLEVERDYAEGTLLLVPWLKVVED